MIAAQVLLFIIPGQMELVLIVLAILLLFGGKKIPEMMRGLGTGVKEFKKGIKDEPANSEQIENEKKENGDNKPSSPK